nr:unnamed protein product [Callosobruchus chinensis]CAH7742154.1 unnamed protein product [Callosobruchus chinensis]
MDGTESVTKQLIDGIEIYDELLDAQGAIVRLKWKYTTNAALIFDIKNHPISKKSIPSSQLHNAKQNNKPIDEFGTSIAELLISLTVSQAEGHNNVVPALQKINEKIAVSTFASALRDQGLRTIVKARNYEKLSDAIQGTKDE